MSPTARSLNRLRKEQWTAEVVEHHNSFSHKKKDLFGFADIYAVRPGGGNLLIQATSASNHAARRTKLLEEPRVLTYLSASKDNRAEVWSWGQRVAYRKDGSKAKRPAWTLRREAVFFVPESRRLAVNATGEQAG